MRAAARCKGTNPIRVRNLARFALRKDHIFARHRSPLHIRRTRTSPAIDAMTIDQRNWPTFHHVSCPAAKASTSEFHKIVWQINKSGEQEIRQKFVAVGRRLRPFLHVERPCLRCSGADNTWANGMNFPCFLRSSDNPTFSASRRSHDTWPARRRRKAQPRDATKDEADANQHSEHPGGAGRPLGPDHNRKD